MQSIIKNSFVEFFQLIPKTKDSLLVLYSPAEFFGDNNSLRIDFGEKGGQDSPIVEEVNASWKEITDSASMKPD